MLNKNIVDYMGCDCTYEEADIVLYGAPFDSTTSFRPGTRFAGGAIRADSYGLELYSPYQDRSLEECRVFDMGDLELAIGSSKKVLDQIEETAGEIFRDGKLPFLIGGEHLVTLGSVRAAARKYPDLHILHFDAHTDLREDYLGVSCPTPASFGGVGSCWGMAASTSSASAPGRGRSLAGPGRDTRIFILSPWRDWGRRWRN